MLGKVGKVIPVGNLKEFPKNNDVNLEDTVKEDIPLLLSFNHYGWKFRDMISYDKKILILK